MNRLIQWTRYAIIIPILGLSLAALTFFVFGGVGLVVAIVSAAAAALGFGGGGGGEHLPFAIQIVEYVHQFLIGTVLIITALGFYQLFIAAVDVPEWLRVHSTEQLETALVGVAVVVIAVHFMTSVFTKQAGDLLALGLGSGAVIASLALFTYLRTLAEKVEHDRVAHPPTDN